MDSILPLILSMVLVVGLWARLERTHRRTQHLSRTPFGADLEGDRDIARTLAEVDAVRARQRRVPSRILSSPPAQKHRKGSSTRSHLRPI